MICNAVYLTMIIPHGLMNVITNIRWCDLFFPPKLASRIFNNVGFRPWLPIAFQTQVVLGKLLAALVPVVGFNAAVTSERFASFLLSSSCLLFIHTYRISSSNVAGVVIAADGIKSEPYHSS